MTPPARPTLDTGELSERVLAAVRREDSSASIADLRPIHGGESSLTYSVSIVGAVHPRGQRAVLKIAPPGLPPTKNRDVLRQARLLRKLNDSAAVRVPEVLFEDPGHGPEHPPFFGMSYVEGECFEPVGDPLADGQALPGPEDVRARMLDCARQLGSLHAVNPSDVGLTDEPVTTLPTEIERWARVIAHVDEDLTEGWERVHDRLRATAPSEIGPVIVHGDFRLGNAVVANGRVQAVFDFEIWSLGDPRIDLSWFLSHTSSARLPSAERELDGVPTEEELIREYVSAGGAGSADLAWFHAFTQFKGAAITGQIVKHNRRSSEPSPRVVRWDPHVPRQWLTNARMLLASLR